MAWTGNKSWSPSDVIESPADELNRIEGNQEYLESALDFTRISNQTHKTDWTMADYPTAAQAQNIDDNIRELATMYHLPFATRNWSSLVRADWQLWTDWERTQATAKTIADLAAPTYCGTLSTGEDGDIY